MIFRLSNKNNNLTFYSRRVRMGRKRETTDHEFQILFCRGRGPERSPGNGQVETFASTFFSCVSTAGGNVIRMVRS